MVAMYTPLIGEYALLWFKKFVEKKKKNLDGIR